MFEVRTVWFPLVLMLEAREVTKQLLRQAKAELYLTVTVFLQLISFLYRMQKTCSVVLKVVVGIV